MHILSARPPEIHQQNLSRLREFEQGSIVYLWAAWGVGQGRDW